MQLLLAFLFGTFIVGGLSGRAQFFRRPPALFGVCLAVGVLFYSVRIL